MNREELLKSSAASIGVELNDVQVAQFIKYYEILVEWNSFMNLTGITEYEEVIQKHFVDSLALCKSMDVQNIETLIDMIRQGNDRPPRLILISAQRIDCESVFKIDNK